MLPYVPTFYKTSTKSVRINNSSEKNTIPQTAQPTINSSMMSKKRNAKKSYLYIQWITKISQMPDQIVPVGSSAGNLTRWSETIILSHHLTI